MNGSTIRAPSRGSATSGSALRGSAAGGPPDLDRAAPSASYRLRRTILRGLLVLGAIPSAAFAQQTPSPAAGAVLHLTELHDAAVRRDPRTGGLELLTAQSALRMRNLDAERMPALGVSALAQYQSDVVSLPAGLPGTGGAPQPPHDTYDAHVAARVALYDPSRARRRSVEAANLSESQARVETATWTLRQGVSDAYFAALRARAQRAELVAAMIDLEAQLETARDQLRERAVLPSAVLTLEAELLRRGQAISELDAAMRASRDVLGQLTGRQIGTADSLRMPDLAGAVASVLDGDALPRERPEYIQFARARDVLERQAAVLGAQSLPRVAAVGRAGYGRPGLNPLAASFSEYWVGGVQLEWSPWNWGVTSRRREELTLQQQILAAEEAAFTESLRRSIAHDVATIDRLEATLDDDARIIDLRERILAETRLRHTEGVITSAEYVDRQTDLLAARLARATHLVQLAEARARVLTILGVEVPR